MAARLLAAGGEGLPAVGGRKVDDGEGLGRGAFGPLVVRVGEGVALQRARLWE